MSSTPKQPSRARYSLPASLIFAPQELKQFRRWQRLFTTLKPTECGILPNAVEYEEFQQWLRKQDSGYFSDVFDDIYEHIQPGTSPSEPAIASSCRHPVHPVEADQRPTRCPVCTINVHIKYMKVLTHSLHGANGRPLPSTGTPSEQQENLYLAWSQGKLSTLREVHELEVLSEKEAEWFKDHYDMLAEDVQSASKALDHYWLEITESASTKRCSTQKKKAIAFAEGTNFLPGRPADYFLKRSLRYKPGKYTSLDPEYGNDDDVSEDSEDYASARVFVLGGPPEHDTSVTVEPTHPEDPLEELEDDDGDSDWEDVESDAEDEELSEGSYISFEEDTESSFIVFSND
ncbi:hypothetical protein DE146DRAFT_677773 [Phaeosphaeria sp. MPI-PUGE-AT-0046c]|nr:hypothetical protein DE146DRAFT_677773 [Phaeosphaeria sp. MPI-PUGE-AT-0046c]